MIVVGSSLLSHLFGNNLAVDISNFEDDQEDDEEVHTLSRKLGHKMSSLFPLIPFPVGTVS